MKKQLKTLTRKSKSQPKAKATTTTASAVVDSNVEVTLYTEDLPKGLQIVAGKPLQPGTAEWQRRQDNFNAKKLAKAELAKEVAPIQGKIVIDLSKIKLAA
ncbi:MAG: hypothetical protein KUG64_10775 [Cycloclasticus sp.]|nr:hypothetical protein [Cycloclasticus sp.]